MSFVYEQRLDSDPKSRFSNAFWLAVQNAASSLAAHENNARAEVPISPLQRRDISQITDTPARFLQGVTQFLDLRQKHFPALLQIFVAHMLFLPSLDLRERARPRVFLPSKLVGILTRDVLPKMFLALENVASVSDLDGRVFAALLDSVLRDDTTPLQALIGPDLQAVLDKLWATLKLPSPDYSALRAQFPTSPSVEGISETQTPTLNLLPFQIGRAHV